jgi:hypothetical protein
VRGRSNRSELTGSGAKGGRGRRAGFAVYQGVCTFVCKWNWIGLVGEIKAERTSR